MKKFLAVLCLLTLLPASALAAEYTIRLGHSDKPSDDSITHITALKFKELAETYSGGKVAVTIYPANQLGDQVDQMRSLQTGAQEMTQGSVNNFANFAPELNYLTLPYILTGVEDARATLDAMWDKHNEWLTQKAGVRALIWTDAGFRNLTTKSRPVRTLADLEGMKVRLPNNPISLSAFQAFGVNPIPMGWGELFSALQQGVVDSQENCYSAVLTEHFDEVQKYATDIEWQYTLSLFIISEAWFQQLPADVREALVKAGKETTAWEREKMDQMEADIVAELKERGMEFVGRPTDYDEWVQRGRGTWEAQYKTIGGGDAEKGKAIVDEIMAAKK